MNELFFGNKVVFLNGLPLTLPISATNPGSPVTGDMYYNSTDNTIHYYNGTTWVSLAATTLTGQALNQNYVLIGDNTNHSTAVSTSSQGNILADVASGLTIKSATITDAMVSPSAAIAYSKLATLSGTTNSVLVRDAGGHVSVSGVQSGNLFLADGSVLATSAFNMSGFKIMNLAAGTTGNDAVNYSQVILANGSNPFTADQSMGGFKLTNLAAGSSPADAVNFNQLTSISTGLIWQGPIDDPDLVDDSLSTPPITPIFSLTYIIAASPTDAWATFAGHAVWWDGTNWIDLSTGNLLSVGLGTPVQIGARFLVASATPGGPSHVGGGLVGKVGDIATVTGNTPGAFAYSFTVPLNNWAVSDQFPGSQHFNNSFTYVTNGPYTFTVTSANATAGATYTNNGQTFTVLTTIVAGLSLLVTGTGAPSNSGILTKATGTGDAVIVFSSYTGSNWIDFAGPSKNVAGTGLAYTGNTINVLVDGITIDTNGSNQLEVKAGGITNTQVSASAAIALTKLAALTANRAVITDGSGFLTFSPTTSTEIGFVSGVTSAIQTQLNGKANTALSNITSQTANTVFAAPNGSAGSPTFRSIVSADIPATLLLGGGGTAGILELADANGIGSTHIQAQLIAGSSYNFNLPTTAGTTGQFLTSGGGAGTAPMTWTTPTTGTVTSVSVVTANGFSGSVATATTTPAITLTGTLTGDITGSLTATVLSATSNATLTTLSALTTASSLASVGTVTSGTWNATTIAILYGGTGATTAAAAFNNLSPMTTPGDIIYENNTPVPARLPIGSTGQVLTVVGGVPAWAATAATATWNKETFTVAASQQTFTLAHTPLANSVSFLVQGAGDQLEGALYDFTVSGAVVTLRNGLATGGVSALVDGDIVQIQYEY